MQDEIAECGIACIVMICNYYGHDIDLGTLRHYARTSIKGVTLADLMALCHRMDLNTRALRVELDELEKINLPAILHWNMNHFVVLSKIKSNKFIIHDPAMGKRYLNKSEVSNAFTGIVLEVFKADNFQRIQSKNKLTLTDLVKNICGLKQNLIFLLILSLVIEVFTLINPLFIQYVTDESLSIASLNNLHVIAIAFVILALLQSFIEYIRSSFIVYISNNINQLLASNIVFHILKLPLDFFEKRHKGDIQSRFQSIDQIQRKLSTDFVNTLLDGLMIIITLIVMSIYSVMLTMVVSAAITAFVLIRYVSYHVLRNKTGEMLKAQAKVSTIFLETLQTILSIKCFAKEQARFNFWHNKFIDYLNINIRISKININYAAAKRVLFGIEKVFVICIGATLTIKNQFSIGMLVAYLTYRGQLVEKSNSFVSNIFDYKLISVLLGRLSDIIFHEVEKTPISVSLPSTIKGDLKVENLAFKYEAHESDIFHSVDLNIKAGEKIVITGHSGCGKTTFLKVLMSLLKKTHGEIFIDGISLTQFGLENFRKITASVMQDDALLIGSILENITFFDESIDIQKAYYAATLAEIHECIVKLPMGYETLIGEMGSSLSGGQRQRIMLARAIYKEPKILFLDEATSNLDFETECKINHSLKSISITQVVISHREETIQMADRVIDLEKYTTKRSN